MLYPLLELHFRGGLMMEQDSSRFMENQPSLFFLWLRTICPKCCMLINFIKSMITFLWLFCSPMFELKMTPIGNIHQGATCCTLQVPLLARSYIETCLSLHIPHCRIRTVISPNTKKDLKIHELKIRMIGAEVHTHRIIIFIYIIYLYNNNRIEKSYRTIINIYKYIIISIIIKSWKRT